MSERNIDSVYVLQNFPIPEFVKSGGWSLCLNTNIK